MPDRTHSFGRAPSTHEEAFNRCGLGRWRTEFLERKTAMTRPVQHTATALQTQLAAGSLAGDWTLDPARSTAKLRGRHMWGLAPVNGYFRVITGNGTVSPAGYVTGSIALATESVDTKNKMRDGHLRGADFLLAEKYAQITFSLDTLVPGDDSATISGTLTVRDISRRISFPATVILSGDNEADFDATVEVDRSEYGMTVNHLAMVKMECSVNLHAVFTKQ
jgi:polyisoprenoid-binding protein YceI